MLLVFRPLDIFLPISFSRDVPSGGVLVLEKILEEKILGETESGS
jgi:hypothetical protein